MFTRKPSQHFNKLKIIEVLGGKTNPSINRRLLYEATNAPVESLIPCFCANREGFYSEMAASGLIMQTGDLSNRL
jgi:hypothetical protein